LKLVTRYWLGKQNVWGSILQSVKVVSFNENVHLGFGAHRPPVHWVQWVQWTFVNLPFSKFEHTFN